MDPKRRPIFNAAFNQQLFEDFLQRLQAFGVEAAAMRLEGFGKTTSVIEGKITVVILLIRQGNVFLAQYFLKGIQVQRFTVANNAVHIKNYCPGFKSREDR